MMIQTAPLARLSVSLGSQITKHLLLLQLELPEMED